jgi:hypothetical protein
MNAEQIIDTVDKLKTDRSNFEQQWQECADYGLPNANQITIRSHPGTTKKDLFDTTAEESIVQAASGLYSYMFPADNKAFMLKIDSEELNDIDEVKEWLSKTTDILHEYLIKSNFRQAFFRFLKYLMCFGTSVMWVEKGKKMPISFLSYHISGIYLTEDDEGNVDQLFNEFEYTARQARIAFGEENLSKELLDTEKENPTKRWKFIHCVYPREKHNNESADPMNWKWADKYVDVDNKKIVQESGHATQPFMADRFDKDALETYGRAPMMRKLPDVKMINEMKKVRVKAWAKMCDPPVIVPDDGSIWPLATQPGGVIFRRGDAEIDYFKFQGNLQGMEEAINDVRATIREGFALQIFDPLVDHKNMTAFETDARIQANMRKTIPLVGQRQSDLFNPMIDRMIDVLGRAGKLPPVPEALIGVDYSVEFLGQIALSLKQLDVMGWMKVMEQVQPLVTAGFDDLARNVMDNYDLDLVYRDSARDNGVPATWIKSTGKRDNERTARAQQQQQQALMENAKDLSGAYNNMSKTPEEGSVAEGLNEQV